MNIDAMSCMNFTDELASKAAVPGGGGASALVGSIGAALGSMVCNLTLGKKKYAEVENEISEILMQTEKLRNKLYLQVERDAEVFEPLSKAYGLPRETEEEKAEKERVMEEALKLACSVPLEIAELSFEAIKLHSKLLPIGSRIAVSDVGVGVALCRSALLGAVLNIYINTKSMADRKYAEEINEKARKLVADGVALADKVYDGVLQIIS